MTLPLNTRVSSMYLTDGTQKDFGFGFRVFYDPDNGGYGIEVRKVTDDGYEIIPKANYLVLPIEDNTAGIIRFHVAPAAGDTIYLAGKTPTIQQLNLTNFGRFSAESIEAQFDFLTAIIQEWISSLGEETAQRINGDLGVKEYTDQLYSDWQLWAEANVPTFAETYLDAEIADFRQQWTDAMNSITAGRVPALIVDSASGQTQQQINDFGGAKWWPKPGGYEIGESVLLNNGVQVRSTVSGNITNPNSSMTGWTLKTDLEIKIWSGRTQESKNKDLITAKDLGLVGDGATNQTAKFAEIELAYSGVLIDLQGGTYKVDARPTGNKYANGWWLTTEKFPVQYVTSIRADNDMIAIGDNAALAEDRARNCIAIGQDALRSNTKGRHNIALGISALHFLNGTSTTGMDGTRNIAIGGNAGRFATTANRNIIMGRDTAHNITTASMNIILGNAAVMGDGPNILTPGVIENQTPLSPQSSVVIGTEAGKHWNASEAVFVGHQAGKNIKTDSFMVGIGAYTFEKHQSDRSYWGKVEQAVNVTCTYAQSGAKTITVTTPSAHGLSTGNKVWLRFVTGKNADTSYSDDIWFDVTVVNSTVFTIQSTENETSSGNALYTRISTNTDFIKNGGQSVGVGYSVGNGVINYRAVGVGHQAGANGLGVENTAIGFRTIFSYSSGVGNTAVGAYSQSDGRGSGNASLGVLSLNVNTADNNTAIGGHALTVNTTGFSNTAIGNSSMRGNTTGTYNTAVGADSLRTNLETGTAFNFTNCSALGYQASVSGNNQVQLGNSSTTTYVYGTVQNRSDARDKADVRDTVLGLDFINSLRPVDYKWDMREDYIETLEGGKIVKHKKDGSKKRHRFHHGFIAQEVQELGNEFGGLQDHSINGGEDVLSIGYDEFVAPLVKAVQELAAEVERLKKELASKK